MRIYDVYVEVDERRSKCAGTCDCMEAAMEFAKTLHNWYHTETLYEQLTNNPKLIPVYITEKELITLGTLANSNN